MKILIQLHSKSKEVSKYRIKKFKKLVIQWKLGTQIKKNNNLIVD